ncbi:hypothetical protein [Rhizobium sp. P44RR-XXIV]|uniref:hypothetical protein n=1 Tax=Rhizobium sp. P44RR-XXIV TaxID=1921145 RepID=UPI0010AA756E|nr:hypothetical protein [Rhizobium sp. P44RR-XXIV]TIX89165.1 hypothetical protein BSK43_021385 [Rhizobium sp. P44RR-XXIV]
MIDLMLTKAMRWVGKAGLVLLAIWGLLLFFSLFGGGFGYGYVSSTEWAAATSSFRIFAGLISAAAGFAIVLKQATESNMGELKKIGAVLIAPVLGYFFGSLPAVAGAPMLLALVAGHHVELPYKVAQADGTGRKGCRSSIDLQDLPYPVASLCGVSEELRQTMRPGMRIMVEGRGTSYGVYASDFRRVGP